MKLSQWTHSEKWICTKSNTHGNNKKLILLFADRFVLEKQKDVYTSLKELHPNSDIISVSTSGQINDANVYDNESVATVIEFEKSSYKIDAVEHNSTLSSSQVGAEFVKKNKSRSFKASIDFFRRNGH